MVDNKSEFSGLAGKRVLKNHSSKRVSGDAATELVNELDYVGGLVARKADEFADHAGRATVQVGDVRRAIRVFEKKLVE